MRTAQVGSLPSQAPDQPAKVEPGSGSALTKTVAPERMSAVQAFAHSNEPRSLETVPPPVPALLSLRLKVEGFNAPVVAAPGG
jgi:hypothetical protein